MFPYVSETFTDEERSLLRHYVTNLDGPVFALVNLPEVVKGALFARYSRSSKSLRRLFLDEFVGDLDVSGDISVDATIGLRRAEELYAKVFGDYGDDSVAQLGGVHLACEQASNVLTKVLEWGRLMSYLEQSTRYIPYDSRFVSGHYRYFRDPQVLDSALGARYIGDMDRMFDTYRSLLPKMREHVVRAHPKPEGVSDLAYRQTVKAKALDAIRGLLPAGALSNVGVYGSGQSFELLLMRMRAHPLPEVQHYAELMVDELRKVIPSFLARLDRPERGGEWVSYLGSRDPAMGKLVEKLWRDEPPGDGAGAPLVDLVDFDPAGEVKVVAAMCSPYTGLSERAVTERVARLKPRERAKIIEAYVGERTNRRHRPGRAFERTSYRFDIVSDYGAFRDLQRHRMLTIEWQPLGTALGWEIPEIVRDAGLAQEYSESIERSGELHEVLAPSFPEQSAYAIALAFHIRYSMQMNAREAMHLIELRSGPQGHDSYRRIAQAMHRQIGEVAGHKAIARSMSFVDHRVTDLGRLEAEGRAQRRRRPPADKPLGAAGGHE